MHFDWRKNAQLGGRWATVAGLFVAFAALGCQQETSDNDIDSKVSPVGRQCDDGLWRNGQLCEQWSTCQPGEFVYAEGSPVVDRQCLACASGTYSTEENAEGCTGWTACVPGEVVKEAGTAVADQVCELCEEGTTTFSQNASACGVPEEGSCLAGQALVPVNLADGQEAVCQSCAPGQYCAGGDAAAEDCGAGTWDDDLSPASPCADWSVCDENAVVAQEGSATSDRNCAPCAEGDCGAVCTDGESRNVACGLNGRGVASQVCQAGVWAAPSETCADPDVCLDGAMEYQSCGPNSRDQKKSECVAGAWVAAGQCEGFGHACDQCVKDSVRVVTVDDCGEGGAADQAQACVKNEAGRFVWTNQGECIPHECEVGETDLQPNGCGLNSRGLQPRRCEVPEGELSATWVNEGECVSDSVCVVNDTRVAPEPCGLNGAGTQLQTCLPVADAAEGDEPYAWQNTGACADPDTCVIGAEVDAFTCGLNGNGAQEAVCPRGLRLVASACEDPDSCAAAQQQVLMTTVCTDGSPGDQAQVCESAEGVFDWTDTMCTPRVCSIGDTRTVEGGCGPNSAGVQEQVCDTLNDTWVNATGAERTLFGADDNGCVDDDVCVNGETRGPDAVLSPTTCGINGRGRLGQVCRAGQWEDDASTCDDTDLCRDGDVTLSSEACSIDNYARAAFLALRCEEGQSVVTDECLGTDSCYEGERRLSASCCSVKGVRGGRYVEVCGGNRAWVRTSECSADANQ